MNLVQANNIPAQILIIILTIWTLIWKGLALWRAAKNNQLYWFIPVLILNTVGILEIIYLFRFAKHRMTIKEITDFFKNLPSKNPRRKHSHSDK